MTEILLDANPNPIRINVNDIQHSDITFLFPDDKNKKLYAHSTVLSVKCPELFKLSFDRDNDVDSRTVTLKCLKTSVFLEFLKYLYTEDCDYTNRHLSLLISLATQFNVPLLKEKCFERFRKGCTTDNALNLLKICREKKFESTALDVLGFVRNNYTKILQSERFYEIDMEMLAEVLKLDDIAPEFTGEMVVIDAVFEYSKRNRGNSSDRDFLEGILKLIRFPTLTQRDFIDFHAKHKFFLSPQEFQDIIMKIADKDDNICEFSDQPRIIPARVYVENDLKPGEICIGLCKNTVFNTAFIEVTGPIPSHSTLFTVDRHIILTSITLGKIETAKNGINIVVKTSCGRKLLDFNTKWRWNVSASKVKFDQFLTLSPSLTYIIELEYQETEEITYCCLHNWENDYVALGKGFEIKFSKLNPMIGHFYCREIK